MLKQRCIQQNPKYKDYNRAKKLSYWNGKMKYCVDVTEEWLGVKKKKNNVIIPHNYNCVKYKGKKYYIDNKHVKIDFKHDEVNLAKIISNFTDKKIELFPRFDYFKSIDSKIGKDYFDFKITTSKTDKFIYSNISSSKKQSYNYIFYIRNKLIPKDIVDFQVDDCFRRIKHLKKLGVFHNDVFTMYKRK